MEVVAAVLLTTTEALEAVAVVEEKHQGQARRPALAHKVITGVYNGIRRRWWR